MKWSTIILSVMLLLGTGVCPGATAIAEDGAADYSGGFWSRSTLTGDWDGARNDLAKKGVAIDLNLTQIVQGDISGGKKTGWDYGSRGNLTLNVDTQKLGLWPGGFFMMEVEGNFGNDIDFNTGAIMPVNSNQFYPMAGSDQLNIPALMFTQFFSEHAGLFAGKIDITSGDANEFAHGKGDTQFVRPAQKQTLVFNMAGSPVISRNNVDTATVLGLRLRLIF